MEMTFFQNTLKKHIIMWNLILNELEYSKSPNIHLAVCCGFLNRKMTSAGWSFPLDPQQAAFCAALKTF